MNLLNDIGERVATATRALVCIDGPAGAGKTTLSDALEATLQDVAVVHMDALYDGWHNALSDDLSRRLVTEVRDPFISGAPVRFRRYDWYKGDFADLLDLGTPRLLIVEGVGSAQLAMRIHATVSVFIDVEPAVGRHRVIERDGELSSAHIDAWQAAEGRHFAADGTRRGVDIYIP